MLELKIFPVNCKRFYSLSQDLCHLHSDKPLILQKIDTIINCFIDSVIPPALQVDIPQEMADNLIHRRKEATPYLFREAQVMWKQEFNIHIL